MSKKRRSYMTVSPDKHKEPSEPELHECVQLGDRVIRTPYFGPNQDGVQLSADVIYIHPAGRYHTVQFERGFCESYLGLKKQI